MITVDESKFKRSDITLYDKNGNVTPVTGIKPTTTIKLSIV